jgi:hypothetical protein
MVKEKNAKPDHQETQVIFRMKPQPHSDVCQIKHVGYLTKDQQLGDEIVDIETTKEMQESHGKNVYHLGKFKGYDIFFIIYRTNMLGSYLVNKSTLPVYSISVMYQKNIVMGYLFDVYVFFDINKESYIKLSTLKTVVNANVNGRYIIKIQGDEELQSNRNKLFESLETIVLEEIAKNNLDNMTEDNILNIYNNRIEEKKKYYTNILDGINIEEYTNNTKFVKTILMPLLTDNNFYDIVNYAIDIREEKRRKELNAMEGEYKIPEKVIKLKEIKENPEKIKEII